MLGGKGCMSLGTMTKSLPRTKMAPAATPLGQSGTRRIAKHVKKPACRQKTGGVLSSCGCSAGKDFCMHTRNKMLEVSEKGFINGI